MFRLKTIVMFLSSWKFCAIVKILGPNFFIHVSYLLSIHFNETKKSRCFWQASAVWFLAYLMPPTVRHSLSCRLMSCNFRILYLVPFSTIQYDCWVPSAAKYCGNVPSLSQWAFVKSYKEFRRNKEKNWVDVSHLKKLKQIHFLALLAWPAQFHSKVRNQRVIFWKRS